MRLRIVLLVLAASLLVLASVLAAVEVLFRPQPRTWIVLGSVGLGALVLSGIIAVWIARSLVRPLIDVATTADRLASGDMSARAGQAGPAEVRKVGTGLNKVARRIGELLAYQQETMADVSHRLRTPMTALRIDAESLQDHFERDRLLVDVDALEATVDDVIVAARRPVRTSLVTCDAVAVVAERTAFWRPLAEDTDRTMTVELADGELPVRVTVADLRTCMDVLLQNVFSHTPDGVALSVRLSARAAGGAWLVVADDGPGFSNTIPAERGSSTTRGSTGLGLDIVRRVAETSGGSLTIGRSASGGGAVTVGLGAATRPVDRMSRHRRTRTGAPASTEPQSYFWLEGE